MFEMLNTKNKQLLGRGLYYLILIIVPLYMLTIGTPHTLEYSNPEGVATIIEEGSYHRSNKNTFLIVRAVNKYQVTEQRASFEIWHVKYFD